MGVVLWAEGHQVAKVVSGCRAPAGSTRKGLGAVDRMINFGPGADRQPESPGPASVIREVPDLRSVPSGPAGQLGLCSAAAQRSQDVSNPGSTCWEAEDGMAPEAWPVSRAVPVGRRILKKAGGL